MDNKKLQLSFLVFLALVIAGAAIATIIGGHKSRSALEAGAKHSKSPTAGTVSQQPVPSLAPSAQANGQFEQQRAGEIAAVRQTRVHPTPENIKKLVALINTNKDTAVLSEALNTLGVLAQRGIDTEQACKLLAQKALDSKFPSRGQALLATAILEKNKALPVVSAFIRSGGAGGSDSRAMLGWASRALGMIATPQSVPLIKELISETTDTGVRGTAFAALAKAGTPEAFSILREQAQMGTGKDQAYSVAALSESKDPQNRQWIREAILDGTLGKDAVTLLATMPAASDIFSKVLVDGGLSPARQLDLLKQISPGLQGNPDRQKLALELAPLVYSGDAKVQEAAMGLVSQNGGKKVAGIIKPLLSSENPQVRRDAFFSYMQFTNADNYKYLFNFLDDSNPQTRRMAIFMIGRFYGASDRSALEQAAQSSDAYIRDKAKQYLSSLN